MSRLASIRVWRLFTSVKKNTSKFSGYWSGGCQGASFSSFCSGVNHGNVVCLPSQKFQYMQKGYHQLFVDPENFGKLGTICEIKTAIRPKTVKMQLPAKFVLIRNEPVVLQKAVIVLVGIFI